jgi:hypothetical protein
VDHRASAPPQRVSAAPQHVSAAPAAASPKPHQPSAVRVPEPMKLWLPLVVGVITFVIGLTCYLLAR